MIDTLYDNVILINLIYDIIINILIIIKLLFFWSELKFKTWYCVGTMLRIDGL
jgi:hypothetical protein